MKEPIQPALPPEALEKMRRFRWECPCGMTGLVVRPTRNGRLWGRCHQCGKVVFWNDVAKFTSPEPFCCCHLRGTGGMISKPTKKKGIVSKWCGVCRIRTFENPAMEELMWERSHRSRIA